MEMSDPEPEPTPTVLQPWDDATKSIATKVGLSEAEATAINTLPDNTTYIRSSLSITNGLTGDNEETIPNLYEAIRTALNGEQGELHTDAIGYLTKSDGDITLTLGEYDETGETTTDTKYSLKKIVQAINILANRTRHMVDPDNDVEIDILADE